MFSSIRELSTPESAGRVAVLAVRALDDLAGGAGLYRVTSSPSVLDEPRETRTVAGMDQLRVEVERWVARFLDDVVQADR